MSYPPPSLPLQKRGASRSIAFTLLELLASTLLLGLIILLTYRMVSQIATSSHRSIDALEERALARSLLDLLDWDVRQSVAPLPGQLKHPPRFRLSPPGAPYANPHLVLLQSDHGEATLHQRVYFVRNDAEPRFCRADFTPPLGPGGVLPLVYEDRDGWLTKVILDESAPASAASGEAGLLSRRVVALWVRALDHRGAPLTKDAAGSRTGYSFDSDAGYTDSLGAVYPAPAYPPAIEVALVTVSDRSESFLASLKRPEISPSDPEDFDAEIEAFLLMQTTPLKERLQVWKRTILLECFTPAKPPPSPTP